MQTQAVEILLIEDNDDDVLLFEEMLIGSRIVNRLHTVRNGEEAMDFLKRRNRHERAPTPNLIFLDIKLPQKDGFEVLREIKADSGLKDIPVIMLTASGRTEDQYTSFMDGACGYMTKPANFENLFVELQRSKFFWSLVRPVYTSSNS